MSRDVLGKYLWRRERDSNPRYPFRYNGFQDRRYQPLTHPSAGLQGCLQLYGQRAFQNRSPVYVRFTALTVLTFYFIPGEQVSAVVSLTSTAGVNSPDLVGLLAAESGLREVCLRDRKLVDLCSPGR
jgi:hypothetical protein